MVRVASIDDIEEIHKVMLDCLPTYDPSFCMPNDLEFFRVMVEGKGIVLVEERLGRIIAYAVLDTSLETEHGNLKKLGIPEREWDSTINFEVCMVLEDYRGQGIQKMFLEETVKIASERNIKHLYSTTHPENLASFKNLKGLGMKEVVLSQNSKEEPRLLLHKPLSEKVLEVRLITESEIGKVLAVYADEIGTKVTEVWLESATKSFSQINGGILGAFTSEGEIAGCLTINLMRDLYLGFTEGPYAHLETIIVKESFHGQGIGSLLVREAVKYCKSKRVTYIIAQTEEDPEKNPHGPFMAKAYEGAGLKREYTNFYLKL